MKKLLLLPLILVLFQISCKEDDFEYEFPELDQLLVAVTQTSADFVSRTEFKYDSLNRLKEIKNIILEEHITTEYFIYDTNNNIVEKRAGNHLTTYTYNSAGQLTEKHENYSSPDSDYEWSTTTRYLYKNGKIVKGIQYAASGEETSYIYYKYDSKGNTLEKIVRSANSDSEFNMEEIKFRYDSKINPNALYGISMFYGYSYAYDGDIKQVNNPVYSSYSNILLSSIPPEYEISYEYNSKGLPTKAVLNNLRSQGQGLVSVVYEYESMEE